MFWWTEQYFHCYHLIGQKKVLGAPQTSTCVIADLINLAHDMEKKMERLPKIRVVKQRFGHELGK